MKFLKDDIIEFMNTADEGNEGEFLNMRFRVKEAFKSAANDGSELIVFNIPGNRRRDIIAHDYQVYLIYRPVKNWFKKMIER